MKIFYTLLVCIVLLNGACSSSKQVSAKQADATAEVGDAERDGSSFEKAIIAKSIDAEYAWLRKNCTDCKFLGQSLRQNKGKHYDVLTVQLSDGSKKDYYFDINRFFGKF